MVTSVTNFGRTGVHDYIVQRVSAVVLLAYVLFLAGFILTADGVTYLEWRSLFAQAWMRYFSLAALIALIAHAWIGMWTIGTDYLTRTALGGAAAPLRLIYNLSCTVAFAIYFAWGVQILWSA
ncbi:MAG TPA: succinate dehydrogenase, hydrophobic membrane anchor protein [Pseudomonadales bacterium]